MDKSFLIKILDHISAGVLVFDRNSKIIYANKNVYFLLDKKNRNIKKYPALFKDDQKITDFIFQELEHGPSAGKVFKIGKNKKNLFLQIIPFAKNHLLLLEDVGEILRVRNEIEKMKTSFVSLASHQLLTPLSSIRYFTEMLKDEEIGTLNEFQMDYISQIYDSTKRMIVLIKELLSASRLESGKFHFNKEGIQLDDLVDAVIEEFSIVTRANNCKIIVSKIPNPLPSLYLDRASLRQIIVNLLDNAIKYSSKKSAIIKVNIEINDKCLLTISDQGIGIPRKDQKKVFDKFFRSDNALKLNANGSGLGLYMVKLLVNALGGEIWFESKEGKGTVFYISLPLRLTEETKA